ncbi:MAG: asparagine synthase-related protein [Caulobacteraceae bacterium]
MPRLLGDFAFAAWDARARRLVLARDAMGGVPLFYHLADGFIAFATDYPGLFAAPDVPRQLDAAALGDYLVLNHRRSEETFYAGVRRVPSGALAIVEGGRLRLQQHWAPNVRAPARRGKLADIIAEARDLLDQAVAARLRSLTPVAAEATGGLDSSAVAATAARLLAPRRLHTLTLLPPPGLSVVPLRGHYPDEHDKVAALGRMHANLDVEFLAPSQPHPNETDPRRMFALVGAPVRNPINYGWFAHLRDRAAESGHRVLLTGQEGNFTLSWDGRLAPFEWFRSFRYDLLVPELLALKRRSGVTWRRVLANSIVQHLEPKAVRRWRYARQPGMYFAWEPYSAVDARFAEMAGLLARSIAAGHEPSLGLPRSGRQARAEAIHAHHEHALDFAAFSPALHGVQLRHPLRDRRLVEFTLSLPETLFSRNGVRRLFARQVLADRLPPQIIEEQRPGTQSPDWYERLTQRRDEIVTEAAALDRSALATRIVDTARVGRMADAWPTEARADQRPGYAGMIAMDRALHLGRFIRWVEGAND